MGWLTRSTTAMQGLVRDVRFSLRSMQRNARFTIVIVVTLTMGIGATVSLFSVTDGLLLRPLPYPGGDALVQVGTSREGDHAAGTSSYLDYMDWRDRQRSFRSLAAVGGTEFIVSGAEAERVSGALVSANLLETLGVHAEAGRLFTAGDDRPGGPPVVLVSHAFAERTFGSSSRAAGSTLIVNGERRDIIGVIPDRGRYPSRASLWVPIERDPLDGRQDRSKRNLTVIGALRPGVTVEAAAGEMRGLAADLARVYPASNEGASASVSRLRERIVGDSGRPLVALAIAALVVLIVACANVATLLLARSSARAREIAVRASLGAGNARIVRLLLTESVLLALAAALAGCLLARASLAFVARAIVNATPAWMTFGIDARAQSFAVVAAVLTGIAFGLAPALRLARLRPGLTLREGGPGATSSGMRRGAVSVEIMLAIVLSSAAWMALRSAREIQRIPLGMDPTGVLTARLDMEQYRNSDPAARARLVEVVESRIRALPDVVEVGAVSLPPIDGCCTQFPARVEGAGLEGGSAPMITGTVATPGYFDAMGIRTVAGRGFTEQDRSGGPLVTVISETFAQRYWPAGDALGHHVDTGIGDAEIVGIVHDVRQTSLFDTPESQFYRPYAEYPVTFVTLAVRARSGDGASLAPSVRRIVGEQAPDVPVFAVRTMHDVLRVATSSSRVFAQLLAAFATVALLLSASGVYAVVNYYVARRSRELSLRMALGAESSQLVRLVIRESAVPAAAGVCGGALVSVVSSRMLAHVLYGVSPVQALGPILAGLLFMMLAVFATWGPARRAAAADPMAVLRLD